MLAADLTNAVAPSAVWFGTSGVLVALTGMLAARDGAVRQASQRQYELGLARLNEHLSPIAHVAHMITYGQAKMYNPIRDHTDFLKLHGLVVQVRRARMWADVTNLLTGATVCGVVVHLAAGVTIVFLGLNDIVPSDASDKSNLLPWLAATAIVLTMLLVKAVIYLIRREG
jgi:hypothetical protein